MQRVKLEISDSIYEHIMFFLKNLPKNLIHISKEEKDIKSQMKKLFEESDPIEVLKNINSPMELKI